MKHSAKQTGTSSRANSEDVVRQLFEALHTSDITYVVPRNYDGLPGYVGKDLDLLVANKDLDAFRRLATDVLRAADWRVTVSRPDRRGLTINGRAAEGASLEIDARTYVSIETSSVQKAIRGFSRKVFTETLERRVVYPDGACPVSVPSARDEWLLLYRQAAMKSSKPVYVDQLRDMIQSDEALATWVSQATDAPFETVLAALGNTDWMLYAGKLLEARAPGGSILSENVTAAKIALGGGMALAPILYFSGPDGAGKTTAIDLVTDWMTENDIPHKKYYSLKIVIRRISRHLVWLKRHKKHKAKTGEPLTMKKIKPPSEDERDRNDGSRYWKLRKHVALVVGVFDMYIGTLMTLRPRLKGQVVLIETSPLDIFIKYHMPEFPKTEALLAPTLQKPTAGFLLRASPESIVARKAELSVDEIADYYDRMDRALRRSGMSDRYIEINSSEGLEVMKADLTREIEKLLG